MKLILLILLLCILFGSMVIYLTNIKQEPKDTDKGTNSPEICQDDFVGPLSESQYKYCERLKHGY